ncbi:hypothetical protein Tco_0461850 [Tanacetum coccineum]
MNYYWPPPVQLVVMDLQRVPAVPAVLSPVLVEWSPVPVVTASMSKFAQAAPVGYGQMSVMLQSLPALCGLPVASLRSKSDTYGQLPAAARSLKLSHPSIDPFKGHRCYLLNSLSRVYPNISNPIADLLGSLSSDLGPRSTPNLFRGGSVISGLSVLRSEDSNCKGGDEVGSGNGDDSGVSGDGGGVVKARSVTTVNFRNTFK